MGFTLTIQLFTLFVTGNFTVEAVGLAVLNSFLVAITAAGTHNISQPSTQITVSTLDYEPVVFKPQVEDVSPPIITPQPTKSNESDPVPQAVQA